MAESAFLGVGTDFGGQPTSGSEAGLNGGPGRRTRRFIVGADNRARDDGMVCNG
jgi:hypothetical protein